jgi:hypothetical protein
MEMSYSYVQYLCAGKGFSTEFIVERRIVEIQSANKKTSIVPNLT